MEYVVAVSLIRLAYIRLGLGSSRREFYAFTAYSIIFTAYSIHPNMNSGENLKFQRNAFCHFTKSWESFPS